MTAATDDVGQATVTFTSASAGLDDVNATSLGAMATASKALLDTGIIDAGAPNCPGSPGDGSVDNRFCTIQHGVDAAAGPNARPPDRGARNLS